MSDEEMRLMYCYYDKDSSKVKMLLGFLVALLATVAFVFYVKFKKGLIDFEAIKFW